MNKSMKIGVMSDCLRLPPRDAIRKAAELGAEGVQVFTTWGEMLPDNMDAARRADFRKFIAGLGIELASLCGDIGPYSDAAQNPDRIAREKRILDLAVDLGTRIVTTHIGVVPGDAADPRYRTMLAALRELAKHANGIGVTLAVETGPEKAVILKRFLDDVGPGIGVNLDPANLVMVAGDDPVAAVRTLKGCIVATHAKDGVQLRPCDPEQEYGAGAPKELGPGFKEVPLGQGGVKWPEYLKALQEVGFKGYLTIEREVGSDPAADIALAIQFLKAKLGRK